MYVFIEVLQGGCVPAAHKVDVVLPSLTGRMMRRELNFLKCPPSSPVRLIWQLTLCVYLCVQVCVCICNISRPVSCIFAMLWKPESINWTIPVSLE